MISIASFDENDNFIITMSVVFYEKLFTFLKIQEAARSGFRELEIEISPESRAERFPLNPLLIRNILDHLNEDGENMAVTTAVAVELQSDSKIKVNIDSKNQIIKIRW